MGLLAGNFREAVKINPLGFIFMPALIYTAANLLLWSPFEWRGRAELLNLIQGVTIFWLAVQNFRTKNHVWFVMIALVSIVILGVAIGIMQFFYRPEWLPKLFDPFASVLNRVSLPGEYLGRASGFFGAPNAYAGFMMMVGFPMLVAGFSRRFTGMARAFFVCAGIIAIGAVFLSMSRGALMLTAVGIFLLPLVVQAKLRTMVMYWLLLGGLFVSTLGMLYAFNPQFQDRITQSIDVGGESSRPVMWQAAWAQFLDAPLIGNGVGGYGVLFEDQRPEGFNRNPIHAHNDYLEMLADQGAVGFLLFWGAVGWIVFKALCEWMRQPVVVKVSGNSRKHSLRTPTHRFILGALGMGLLMFCAHLLLEFHLKTPALMMLFFFYLGLICKCLPGDRLTIPRSGGWQTGILVLGGGLALLIPLLALPIYSGYFYAYNGREMVSQFDQNVSQYKQDEAFYAEMIELLQLAVEETPDHADAWSDLSYAVAAQELLHPGQGERYGEEAEGYARQAIEVCPELPLAWINLGNALAEQAKLGEAGEFYQQATLVAPNRSDVWYYYAVYLNYSPDSRSQALMAVERSILLEPENEEARDLRRKILVP
ncbi:O-antigen ligase family protein [Cerasicoccus maritimus]|uniref:O-antigen ligase family protein n=1 Tax=Cerasicoccus maritimus TaxID=490089 RepID=UPI0028527845|nr:O-antigen ligase family protein [Cerasicoccus maritimus]